MNAYLIHDTSICFHNEDDEVTLKNRFDGSLPHYGLFHKVMNFLSSLGFEVTKDPRIEENYKCLSKDHRYGKKGNLEFKARRYPAGFKIEFFQNIVFENRAGGEYDFNKYDKMPYLIKKQLQLTSNKVSNFFNELGYENVSKPKHITAVDCIKQDYIDSWHKPQKDMNFNLSDIDGTTEKETYNIKDRDEKILYNGQIKYFRDWNGYLCRGKIYHNINNMWWIIINDTEYHNIADFELFDLSPTDEFSRQKKGQPPKEFFEKQKVLGGISAKALAKELHRRHTAKLLL